MLFWKLEYSGLGKESFKKAIKNDFKKLKREYKYDKSGLYYILFFHVVSYKSDKKLKEKVRDFLNVFKSLRKGTNINFCYVQHRLKKPIFYNGQSINKILKSIAQKKRLEG